MYQPNTETIDFDPEGIMMDPFSSLRDWWGFTFERKDGSRIAFNPKVGKAYEQLGAGGVFYPLIVVKHEYSAPSRPASDAYFETDDGSIEVDLYFEYDYGQQGMIKFIRPRWVNGRIAPIKKGEVINGGTITLRGGSVDIQEHSYLLETPFYHGEPWDVTYCPTEYYTAKHFDGTIEAVTSPSAKTQVANQQIRTFRHSKVGVIKVYRQLTFDGELQTWASLNGGLKLHVTDKHFPQVLMGAKGRLNSITGEWIATRGLHNPKRYPRQRHQMHRV